MPLVVSGKAIGQCPCSLADFMKCYPQFKDSSSKLCSQEKITVGPAKLLYIGQREMAASKPDDKVIQILGSEDATTCHIVILRHTGSGATCLSHLDGCQTGEAVEQMVKLVEQLSVADSQGRLELSIVGGFTDERGSSKELSLEILGAFQSLCQEIHLTMACITDMNTVIKNGICWPVIYGIGVRIDSGEIFPATFPDKGPDHPLRSARHFCGGEEVLNIYNPASHQLVIGPFHYGTMRDIDQWCLVPDRFIRKYLSTSPDQEPPGFEAGVRASLIQIRDFPNPRTTVFKNDQPRAYTKEGDGRWVLV